MASPVYLTQSINSSNTTGLLWFNGINPFFINLRFGLSTSNAIKLLILALFIFMVFSVILWSFASGLIVMDLPMPYPPTAIKSIVSGLIFPSRASSQYIWDDANTSNVNILSIVALSLWVILFIS